VESPVLSLLLFGRKGPVIPLSDFGLTKSLGREDILEKGKATHSSLLAWRIPWPEEPGRLQSMGLQSWTRLSD